MKNTSTFGVKLLALSFVFTLLCFYSYSQSTAVPYMTDFESSLQNQNWSHYAPAGTDDWVLVSNGDNYFSPAFTGNYAWGTKSGGNCAPNSQRCLETPYFNLSDTTAHYYMTFYHKRDADYLSHFYLQYWSGAGNTWLSLDDANTSKVNWQTINGFSYSHFTDFEKSEIDLSFIQGINYDSVKFRFLFISDNYSSKGWLIDNFSINRDNQNLIAERGDTIQGINPNFTSINVNTRFHFTNHFNFSALLHNAYYLSKDTLLDNNDYFLGGGGVNTSTYNTYFNQDLNLPPNLNSGKYYVIYQLDTLNLFPESNETDNQNYAVLFMDSIYGTPFIADFESDSEIWNRGSQYTTTTTWEAGNPKIWQLEQAHSGNNSFYTGKPYVLGYDYLESPFLNLSGTTNNVVCYWYKKYRDQLNSNIKLFLPVAGNSNNTNPVFSFDHDQQILNPRIYGWDCGCKNISYLDGEINTKIMFEGDGSSGNELLPYANLAIDDIYIGPQRPDVSIEGEKKNRFTTTSSSIAILDYYLFNSGISQLASTTTRFYWSNDSIFDVNDVLLGEKIESIVPDTNFILSEFSYTKPTLAEGKYYIFYQVDVLNQIQEMREYNNLGYFEITQQQLRSLPYANDFETTTDDWHHSSTLGKDYWQWESADSAVIDNLYFGEKSFVTDLTSNYTPNNRMHLYSPIFDLNQLQNPVLEFDLFGEFNENNQGNIMYSINGGLSWEVLKPNNLSYKRFYSLLKYELSDGRDMYEFENQYYGTELLYGKELPAFQDHRQYQGRDFDNVSHNAIDLTFLKTSNRIQFMLVYANVNDQQNKMTFDNFSITEHRIDITSASHKKLMVNSLDKRIHENLIVKCDNYMTTKTNVSIFCSTDTILDNSDVWVDTTTIPALTPYQNFHYIIDKPTPANYANYNYLLMQIDPDNVLPECNETNNVFFHQLNMDTASNYTYPMLYTFDGDEIDGWKWYYDSTGYDYSTGYGRNSYRFRNKHLTADYCAQYLAGSYLFMDEMMQNYQTSGDYGYYPTYYLESPTYNLMNFTNNYLSFDFTCRGITYTSLFGNDVTEGATFQYSKDGGLIWTTIAKEDPIAQNWYIWYDTLASMAEPGWGFVPNLTTAKYNISFLSGNPAVKFRYKIKSIHGGNDPSTFHPNFLVDNFKVGSYPELPPVEICSNDSTLIFGTQEHIAGYYYDTIPGSNQSGGITIQKLIVHPIYTGSNTATACQNDGFTFPDGYSISHFNTYTMLHTNHLSSIHGCDSTVTTTLTMIPLDTVIYKWFGQLFSNVANLTTTSEYTFQWLDCSNNYTPIPNATDSSYTPTNDGTYCVIIDHYGCIDTSNCISMIGLGINELSNNHLIDVYPNPTNGKINIDYVSSNNIEFVSLSIKNTIGQELFEHTFTASEKIATEIQGSSGIYFIELISSDGNKIITKVIKSE